jgi:hypothetical protein
MTIALPKVQVGEPTGFELLTVFPLFAESSGVVDYCLSHEAIGDSSVVVEEVSQGGSVPNLLVDNRGDTRVLFVEGEELIGAKQNRIVNTSVLIAAGSKVKIPVSCVEQGRWGYRSRHFQSSGSHSSSKLRHALKASVAKSAIAMKGHRSDQSSIWREVERQQTALGTSSDTLAMSDTFVAHEVRVANYQERLKYVEGASGIAVAIGNNVVALDLFDKPSTCRKLWNRLLSGFTLDALESAPCEQHASVDDVQQLLDLARAASWQQVQAVGEGEEHRADFGQDHASVLSLKGLLIHASVVTST